MAARDNRFYNQDGLGASIASLADIFAPPDGSDVAGWAQGAATRANAQRLADVFAAAQDGSVPLETLDRLGVGAGVFSPNQSYHAVGVADATNRRGQDITSGDNRYNTDVVAQTSLANNAGDNQALIAQQLLAPVSQDAARAGLSPELASVFDLPAQPGFAGPVGRTTLTEAQGAAFGNLTPEEQRQSVVSDTELEQAIDPVTGLPVYVARPDAVGMTPFNSAQEGVYGDYLDPTDPEGKRIIAVPHHIARAAGYTVAPTKSGTTVNVGGEGNALDKTLSGKEGEQWAAYKELGATSAANLQDFQLLDELLTLAPQGALQGRLAAAFPGFNSAADAVQSIVKRIAPTMRAPGSGATSDIEYAGMLASLPALQNNAEGNALINSIMKAKMDHNIKRAEVVTRYQNGELEGGQAEARRLLTELDRQSIVTPEMADAINVIAPGTIKVPSGTPAPAGGTPATPANRPLVKTQAEYDALPSGTEYVEEDGQTYRKP